MFLITTIIAYLVGGRALDNDDVDPDEEEATLAEEEMWLFRKKKGKGKRLDPIDEAILEKIRNERIKEVEIW